MLMIYMDTITALLYKFALCIIFLITKVSSCGTTMLTMVPLHMECTHYSVLMFADAL